MKTLKNLNHWIAELRAIAKAYGVKTEEGKLLSEKEINKIFNKDGFEVDFDEGLTPEEAFDNLLDSWAE